MRDMWFYLQAAAGALRRKSGGEANVTWHVIFKVEKWRPATQLAAVAYPNDSTPVFREAKDFLIPPDADTGFQLAGTTQSGLDGSKCQRAVATTSPSLDFGVAISLDSMGSGLHRDRLSEMVRARAEAHSGVSDRESISTHQRSPSLKMISISTQRWTKSMVIPALTQLSNP